MTTAKNNDKRGKPKKASPAAATGGKGPSFENRVQAQRLLAMCLAQKSCPGVPNGYRITQLKFQAKAFGYNTDDLVCTTEDDYGNSSQVLMQVKRNLTPGSPSFEEAVGLAWLDFDTGVLHRRQDRIVIAYDITSVGSMKGCSDLAKLAQSSTSAEAFRLKATADGVSNAKKRKALEAVQAAVDLYARRSVPLVEVLAFLQHVDFLHQDLDTDSTEAASHCQQQIGLATSFVARHPLMSDAVWSKLVTACMDLNGVGGEVDLSNVGLHIGPDLDHRFGIFRESQLRGMFQPLAAHVDKPNESGFGVAQVSLARVTKTTSEPQGQAADVVPAARETSVNKYISRRLDQLAADIKLCRYGPVLRDLEDLGYDLKALDEHQKARWYLMRGTCVWNLHGATGQAADDFLKAAELCDDEDKLAAARVRGYLLKEDVSAALAAGEAARERFPSSLVVWVAATNARIANSETIDLDDIPVEHREEAVAYQLVATAIGKRGDYKKAFDVALQGLVKNAPSFFTKETALRYGLSLAQQSPLDMAFRMQDPLLRAGLRKVADSFTPRRQALWSVESPKLVSAAVTHLAYVYLLLGEPSETLDLVAEADTRSVDTEGATLRPQIEALRDLGRYSEAVSMGLSNVGTMPLDGLIGLAQLAADRLDHAALDAVVRQVRERCDLEERRGDLLVTLQVLKWDMLMRTGGAAQVREEAVAENVLVGNSFEKNLLAARAFLHGPDPAEFKRYLDRVRALSQTEEKPGAKYLFSRLLLEAKDYREAAVALVEIIPKGAFSELHVDLLFCYVRTGQRARAKKLIDSFPPAWTDNQNARHLAIELGQMVGDWELLKTLVAPQLRHQPVSAMTWLFSLMVATRESPAAVLDVLARIPPIVEGSIKEIAQIAAAELRSSRAAEGLRRLYRLRRSNLGDSDAASTHFALVATAPEGLPDLELELPVVTAGSAVRIVLGNGESLWRTIDPTGMGDLQSTEEFLNADSREAAVLLGRRKGEVIVNEDVFGQETTLVVAEVTSAHRRLLALSNEAIKNPLARNAAVVHVEFPLDGDGNPQLTPLLHQLEARAARADQMLRLYGASEITLGGLARLVGRSEFDFVRGWAQDGPLLYVGGGPATERATAINAIENGQRFVVDITALTELALVGQLPLLGSLPTVLVTAATRDVIERKIVEEQHLPGNGQAVLHEGRVAFAPATEDSQAAELRFLIDIREAISAYATVVPSYGPAEGTPLLEQLSAVVSAQEFSAVLAALEHDAVLLTLDGRLRELAAGVGVAGTWPQALLVAKRGFELNVRDYTVAVVQMFLGRREFIALGSEELEVAAVQGGWLLNNLVNSLRIRLSESSIDFESAGNAVIGFLQRISQRQSTQFGVVLELYGHLLEPLLRHPSCPPKFEQEATRRLHEMLAPTASAHLYRKALETVAEQALVRTKVPAQPVTIRATVLFCTVEPCLRNGLTEGVGPLSALSDSESEGKTTAQGVRADLEPSASQAEPESNS
jgi:tetratricopeptide (TPR) repeat protein